MPRVEERIGTLLEKTSNYDKDERYMATSDLCNELNKNIELTPDLEKRICAAVLKQLDDKSNDVQSIAVKCIAILVTKIHENQVKEIAEKLSELLLTGTSELRDIYTIGLKTIVSDVSLRVGTTVTTHICSRLLSGLSQDTEQAIKSESLDILTDILRRFGHDIATKHEAILDLCMIFLCDPSALVKKRASACTAALGLVVSEALLIRLVEDIITRIDQPNQGDDVRTLIQTIGLLSRNVGHRLGRHLNTTVPMFLKYCGTPDDESSQNEASDDLRENCFQGFESFLLRCPSEVTSHVESILQATMNFISYDPNYHYASEDEDDAMSDGDEDEFSDDGGDYSDDDDTSWKVRRAALRNLSAIITTRTQELKMICEKYMTLLISRFKEREDNVRVEVFTVFSQLLLTLEGSHKAGNDHNENYVLLLEPHVSSVVTAASRQLGPKSSVASRCAVISTLTRLSSIKGCKLGMYLDEIMPNLFNAAEDRHSDLKLDALEFIRVLVGDQKSELLKPYVSRIVSLAVASASDDWYKIVAKAMKLIESLVNVFSCDISTLKPHVLPLYEAVYSRLNSHDIDQEIKESAILTMGRIICVLGNELTEQTGKVLRIMMERLQNEVTRIHAMKAIADIANSKLNLDMSLILEECITLLAQFLRQQSRSLKVAAVDTLKQLIVSKGHQINTRLLPEVLAETSPLIGDNDLQLCRQGLSLVSLILDVCPAIVSEDALLNKTLPNVLLLAQSSLIQGPTLDALKNVLGHLTRMNSTACTFDSLFRTLLESTSKSLELSKHALLNLARCIAVICLDSSPMNQKMAFRTFVDYLTPGTTEKRQILALYCLGEFGRQIQVKDFGEIKDNVVACFGRDSEEIKSAAAYSLGNICIGNMEEYFDSIIQNLQGQNSYLLLTALREVIAHYSVWHSDIFSSYIDQVTPVLQTLSEREEEGIRNVVAECLGKLAIIDGHSLLPIISDMCASTHSPRTRWTAVTSIKHIMQGPADSSALGELEPRMSILLSAISDDDLQVRRAGLLAANAAAHHHPRFVLPYVKAPILPALLSATEIKLERVVDLGPFKHKVDDGLPLRKAAYACIDTLLETLPEEIDVNPMFGYLQTGLSDHDDVQILCHQILVKICRVKPSAVLFGLDVILEPLEKTTGKKIKEDQVGTEVERVNDLIRSALRAVFAISLVRDVDHPKFNVYFDRLQNTETLSKMLESIRSERFDGIGTRK